MSDYTGLDMTTAGILLVTAERFLVTIHDTIEEAAQDLGKRSGYSPEAVHAVTGAAFRAAVSPPLYAAGCMLDEVGDGKITIEQAALALARILASHRHTRPEEGAEEN